MINSVLIFRPRKTYDKVAHYHQFYSTLWWICWLSLLRGPKRIVKRKGQCLIQYKMACLSYTTLMILFIFMDHDFDQARNMKLLLCTFEQLSGLTINFKVKSFASVKPKNVRHSTHNCLATRLAHSLFCYLLGILMHFRKLNIKTRKGLKIESKKGLPLDDKGKFVYGDFRRSVWLQISD